MFNRLIADGVELPVAQVQSLGFLQLERAGTAAAEEGKLIAGFVDRTVAVDALGDAQSWPVGARRGD